MVCNTFICTILFGLLESTYIALFKDLDEKVFGSKVAEMAFLCNFPLL